MDKGEEIRLHRAIDQTLHDNLDFGRAIRIGVRELILDAIEGAGFIIVAAPESPAVGDVKNDYGQLPDYNKVADRID